MKKTLLLILIAIVFMCLTSLLSACATNADPTDTDIEEPHVNYYSLIYSATEGGRIEGEAEQLVQEGENAKEVTAVPEEGYYFVKWSDNIYSATRQDKAVKKDKSVSAVFAIRTIKVSYTVNLSKAGTIVGKATQAVKYGEEAEEVTAVANDGYYFVEWSDGLKTATRHDINVLAELYITAKFQIKTYTVQYMVGEGGRLEGEAVQTVKHGEDAKHVYVVANWHYYFVKWSDGEQSNNRFDKNITSDLIVTAEFEKQIINLRYVAGEGGKIIGNLNQFVRYKDYAEEVIAVPNAGYVFGGWSDASLSLSRQDCPDMFADEFEYVAYFEPIEKTFRYDYGIASVSSLKSGITINRDKLQNIEFVIPELAGYTFCGWYADKNYSLKVVDSDGKYMLGNYGLSIETDTLYARWKKNGENEGYVHKILLVFVQELNATLYSTKIKENIEVDYKMTSIERAFCSILPGKMSHYLNKWFKETDIRFEVDSYYTLQTVGEESMDSTLTSAHETSYGLMAKDIFEIASLNALYHNVIVVFGMNDYDYLLHSASGGSYTKYAEVNIEGFLNGYIKNHDPLQEALEELRSVENYEEDRGLETCLHEFAHTCEQYFLNEINNGKIFEYHEVYYYGYIKRASELGLTNAQAAFEGTRLYLLGKAEYQGKIGGIPMEYWRHEIDIPVNYVARPVEGERAGIINYLFKPEGDRRGRVTYGSSVVVEAVPTDGYRFLRWSDGVTTAIRTDTDIISYLTVKAIFTERIGVNYVPETLASDFDGGRIVVVGEVEDSGVNYIDRDVPYGSSITVEAVPHEGYRFLTWSDGVTTAIRTDTVISFLKVQAFFIKEELLPDDWLY